MGRQQGEPEGLDSGRACGGGLNRQGDAFRAAVQMRQWSQSAECHNEIAELRLDPGHALDPDLASWARVLVIEGAKRHAELRGESAQQDLRVGAREDPVLP